MSNEEKSAVSLFEHYQERMNNVATSSGRRYNFNKMKELYDKYPIIRAMWDFIADARLICDRFVRRAITAVKSILTRSNKSIEWGEKAVDIPDGREQLYLIRLFNSANELVWSKVGTTTRTIEKRMREHLRAYHKNDIVRIVIDRTYDCGDVPAEGLESMFRAHYIKKYPKTFKKNDRFAGVLFDLDEADKMFADFVAA